MERKEIWFDHPGCCKSKIIFEEGSRCGDCGKPRFVLGIRSYALDPDAERDYTKGDPWSRCIPCALEMFHDNPEVLDQIKKYLTDNPELALE
ncbi:MAG TPA: hypothetical protein VNX68_16315 [Nitrosopumilaceae archaeon]|jgi:hypothetical protein|nr:hypothetical protein [Nitrosopumilaceae archaeon]